MLKKLFPLLIATLFVLNYTACDSGSDSKSTVSSTPPAEVSAMSGQVYTAVYMAMAQATSTVGTKVSATSGTIHYTGTGPYAGVSATGNWSYAAPVYTYNITFTWNGFTYNNVTLSTGTITLSETYNISTHYFSYDYTGDFSVVYNSVTYTWDWDISVVLNNGTYSADGTYTVNGSTYTWSYAGTAK